MTDLSLLVEADGPAFGIHNEDGTSPIVVVCEHASNCVPTLLKNLGLTVSQLDTHVAWDPGAAILARKLSDAFDAPLIEARFSRLVYDCNRPPDAPSAMPADTEVCAIPGNAKITKAERQTRTREIYEPFHVAVTETLNRHRSAGRTPVLITVHSFTPVFHGKARDVEIGLLHGQDDRLARAMMEAIEHAPYDTRANEPYGPEDGVLHSIEKHLTNDPMPYVMIEIRNDLLATDDGLSDIFALLSRSISQAVTSLDLHPPLAKPDVSDA
ncbi:putative N-formylglutamate amidohydrolase [Litoreibacter meonggei]|uniref:Putative N-formylglutamate amidohydrolase n=1 Tax=Litoreibacter meonggei TaxID=1049199 RepID=A0A497X3U8_9RHOB|nr:N-formylglutamate amidohydrolase [Litoreibacter meonggei]RLJ58864.1 putative N-formylglutamate amidohydrolase [Litoreibacter meonggei]